MKLKTIAVKLHLWLGMATGLVVFIIGITGCLYAFIDELKPIVYQDRLVIEAPEHAQRLPLSMLKDSAQKKLGEAYPLQGAEIPALKNGTVIFRTRKFNEHAFLYSNYIEYYYRVYVNPYTGQVVAIENTKWEFFNVVVNTHIHLLLGHDIGGQIVSWSVLLFVITLITGLILWWPKNKKSAGKRLRFQWKETTKWKRKNYDLHNIAGFYIFIITLVIAITGMVWAFKWFDQKVQWAANGGKEFEKPKTVFSDTTITVTTFSSDSLIAHTCRQFPDATCFVGFPKSAKNPLTLFMDYEHVSEDVSLKYDQHTGKLLEHTTYADKNNGAKIRALNYDIHTGNILDLPGKILAFIASLVAASLPVTGFLIWYGKGGKKNKAKEKP